MTLRAKICGINSVEAMEAAGGASHVGLVFYKPSPRALAPEAAAALASHVPAGVKRVGLFVDADDETIAQILAAVPLDLLQLHGAETPARVAEVKRRFETPVMKAIGITDAEDVDAAAAYLDVADWLLFDARPPADITDALPGGNALAFEWSWLAGRDWPLPWMLAGGIDAGNVAEAVARSGAAQVDISSGVEDAPGRKNPEKIRQFLAAVAAL